jgi:hypothetical protein
MRIFNLKWMLSPGRKHLPWRIRSIPRRNVDDTLEVTEMPAVYACTPHPFRELSVRCAVRLLVLICLLLPAAFAGQSLVMTPGRSGRYTIPSTPAFTSVSDFRMEIRIHGYSGPNSEHYSNVWETGLLNIRYGLKGTNNLSVFDTSGIGLANAWIPMGGRADAILRIQRFMSAGRFTVEIWDTEGKNYVLLQGASPKTPRDISGRRSIGGPQTDLKIGWVRLYSKTVPVGGAPPSGFDDADLANWQLDGNTDEPTSGMNLSISGTEYIDTPVYAPVAQPRLLSDSGSASKTTEESTVRADQPLQLNGVDSYSLKATKGLRFSWEQLEGPSPVKWSDAATANPTVSNLVFGEYKVKLTVTDEDGDQTFKELDFGSVPTKDNGVVANPDSNVEFVFGPLLRYGASPWSWQDENHRDLAEAYGRAVQEGNGKWAADWKTQLAGTVTTTKGSRVITGNGTSFQTDFCGSPGKTTPVDSYTVVVLWNGSQRYPAVVSSCQSDTSLVVATGEENNYPALNEVPVSRTLNGAWWGGAWNGTGGSNNANYYDNVMAHYALYYRTGLTRYRDYARNLADTWYDSPFFLKAPYPRLWSLGGIMWRASEDGKAEWWDRLHPALDQWARQIIVPSTLGDVREEAYKVAFVALASRLTPDHARADRYRQAVLDAAQKRWNPQRQEDGSWLTQTYGYASWNGKVGKANLTNGSATVTGVGTTGSDAHPGSGWNPSRIGNCFYAPGDSEAYTVVGVPSATEVTLDRPYNGTTKENFGWQMSNLCGKGVQPFMMGIIGTTWDYVYKLTGDPLARDFVTGVANWILNNGVQESTKGLYYGRIFPNCEPIRDKRPSCSYDPGSTGSVEASRVLTGEVLGALSAGYGIEKNPSMRAKNDKLYGAVFGKDDGPEADGVYATLLKASANGCCPKNFGFFYGFGHASNWPAIRLSGSPPPDPAQSHREPADRKRGR